MPSWGTRRRCSPGRWSRTARAGTARPPSGATSTTGWSPPARCGRLRRFAYGLWQLANVLVLSVPLGLALVLYFLEHIPVLPRLIEPGTTTAVTTPPCTCRCSATSRVLFVGGIVAGLAFVATVPRLVQGGLREDAVAPALRDPLLAVPGRWRGRRTPGFYTCCSATPRAIVHYLRLVGYRFGRPLVQSGSNFGVAVRHENPYLSGGRQRDDGCRTDCRS